MNSDVHDALASRFTNHSIVRQLHDVPPHEVYEVRVEGRRAVCKIDVGPTGNAAIEGRVTRRIGDRTTVPVPEILHVGDDYYVAAWHPSAPAPDEGRVVDETWARAAGRGLATLHDESARLVSEYGQFRFRNGELGVAGHDDWHAAAIAYVRRYRPTLTRYGHADVAAAVVDFLHEHPNVFDGADGPVCCHGWATPDHVAVGDDGVTCIVDFEHTMAAPSEFDYWRTVLPTFGDDDESALRTFREEYESVRTLPAGFERRRPFYLLLNEVYYFESLYVQNHGQSESTTARAEWFRNSVFEKLDRLS